MQNSYSFVLNLQSPGYKAKFKLNDGTKFEVTEYWTFLDNQNRDIVDNLSHIIIIRQKNKRDRAYIKKFEAYPLEQVEYTPIEKNIGNSFYWFSVSFREYDEVFTPRGSGSPQHIFCKITFTRVSEDRGTPQYDTLKRRSSFRKRYNYTSLANISSSDVKYVTMKTVLEHMLKAMEESNTDMKNQAIDFIVKNFTELKSTDMWQDFSSKHRELKDKIMDSIIEHVAYQSELASMVLQKTVSQWDVAGDS